MSILLGFLAFAVWAFLVPPGVLIAIVLLIVGLSTDDRDQVLRRQRLRLAMLFGVVPLGGAVGVSVLAALVAVVETAILAG